MQGGDFSNCQQNEEVSQNSYYGQGNIEGKVDQIRRGKVTNVKKSSEKCEHRRSRLLTLVALTSLEKLLEIFRSISKQRDASKVVLV